MSLAEPLARFRPRGDAYLQVQKDGAWRQLPLDEELVDLPPHWDERLAKPKPRARIQRVPAGHLFIPLGVTATINDREVQKQHVLRGGEEIRFDRFYAVYTSTTEGLPWPMTLIVWPPEGPPLEIRTHRCRIDIGARQGDLLIDDEYIDGLHCIIKRYRNGLMQIEDNGSYNGVYVDGVRVEDGMNLRDGAEIRIGNSRLKAWADPPEVPDYGGGPPVQDQFDLPDDGLHPKAGEPLQPYALELGPDYAERRRRTFHDDVPTRPGFEDDRVDVRPAMRPTDQDGYHAEEDAGGGLPEWAPMARNKPEAWAGKQRSRFQDSDTGEHWARREGNITLVHEKDRNIAPSRRRPKGPPHRRR